MLWNLFKYTIICALVVAFEPNQALEIVSDALTKARADANTVGADSNSEVLSSSHDSPIDEAQTIADSQESKQVEEDIQEAEHTMAISSMEAEQVEVERHEVELQEVERLESQLEHKVDVYKYTVEVMLSFRMVSQSFSLRC
jgi:hypothetical protein